MPAYWYECTVCGHVSEAVFPVSLKPVSVECDRCGALARSIMAPVSFKMSNLAEDRDRDAQRALHQQREENEWALVLGRDVERNGSKNHTSDPTEPRAFEVQRKKARIKSGEPVPKRFAHLARK